jgi:DNA repair protein RadC
MNNASTTEQANRWSSPGPAARPAERAWELPGDDPNHAPRRQVTPSRTPRRTRATSAAVFEYTFTRRRIAEPVGTIRSPEDVAAILAAYVRPDEAEQERLAVAVLDVKNNVIGVETVYVGNTTGSPVRVGEVFRSAVRLNAAAIVIAHNHPSGDPSPSADDIRLTGELASAGRVLDIDFLDHVVLGSFGRSASMRALGYLG